MIEKNIQSHQTIYHKKITAYIDGSLSSEERSEFEAYVRTHPEFETLIEKKEQELSLLRSLIPAINPEPETQASIESEMKLSVFNLLKSEPKNFLDNIKNKFEEWSNR
jgi:anti-sigma-K factor RskA